MDTSLAGIQQESVAHASQMAPFIGPGIRPEMLEMLNGTHPSTSCRIHDLAAEFEVADTSQRRNPLIWSGTFEARYNSATNSFHHFDL